MEAALQTTARFAPMSVAGVVRMRNAPDGEAIRSALNVLQDRHPLLRARIVTSRRNLMFDASPEVPRIPLDVRSRTSDDHWQKVATHIVNTGIDTEVGPLVSCVYLHDTDAKEGDLIFSYDHAVMDATSAGHMYGQILGLCSGTVDPKTLTPLALPPSIDQLLPERLTGVSRIVPLMRYMGRQGADEFGYVRTNRGRAASISATARCTTLTRSLDASTTDSLVTRARTRLLTMNSVIGAALLRATYDVRHEGDELPLRCITFADLRPALEPGPPPDVLGCYLSMLRYTLTVGPGSDVWAIALAFQEKVRGSMARDEHLLSAGVANQLMKMMVATKRTRMATTAVSYAGPLALAASYGDIEVTDVHGFISNNRLGPVATAFVTIFRGRLTWDFVFLDTDMTTAEAEQIADRTFAIVRSAAIE